MGYIRNLNRGEYPGPGCAANAEDHGYIFRQGLSAPAGKPLSIGGHDMDRNRLYRMIPKVDVLLENETVEMLAVRYGHGIVMDMIHKEMDRLRELIRNTDDSENVEREISQLPQAIQKETEALFIPNVRKVINATGTILHTNLGRAPISRRHAELLADIVSGYSNLEYNLEEGRRGERYAHFEKLICRLTGAEAAMVVNNNAAAVLLVLSTIATGGEAIVSRGELVEIGGKFRIPDVMKQSGARLVEVGTTNKTHYSDYEEAITEETKALMKVHTSNYRITGFTESVPLIELRKLADEHDLPLIEDLGSGVLVDLEKYGLTHEPTVQESIAGGVDVVCFSGDKLLGGPQAGIIIGKKKYIDRMKKNQLTRAIRVDKFTVTVLELVLMEYLNEEKACENVPVLRMIRETEETLMPRAERLAEMIMRENVAAEITVEKIYSQVGGGSLPSELLEGVAVSVHPLDMSAGRLEEAMRKSAHPIIVRTADDCVKMDVRTVLDEEFDTIARVLADILAGGN